MQRTKSFVSMAVFFAIPVIVFLIMGFRSPWNSNLLPADCFIVVERGFNKNCDNNYFVRWRNSCKEEMDLQYAFMTKDGNIRSGASFDVDPGEITGGSACNATGAYKIWYRPSSKASQIKFPNDKEIKENW